MIRYNPTGNSVYDAVEAAAQSVYQQAISTGTVSDGQFIALEIQYLYTCWVSAILQYPATTDGTAQNKVQIPGAATGPELSWLAKNLATQLRNYGFKGFPPSLWKVESATIVNGGSATYIVGDTMTLTGTGEFGAATAATFSVATLSAGAIATMTVKYPSLYSVPPSGTIALTGGSGGGSPTATIVVRQHPVHFNS